MTNGVLLLFDFYYQVTWQMFILNIQSKRYAIPLKSGEMPSFFRST